MTPKQPPSGEEPGKPTDFDWESPRWRDREEATNEDERGRRFRGDRAPLQRGAIDAAESVRSGDPPEPRPKDPSAE